MGRDVTVESVITSSLFRLRVALVLTQGSVVYPAEVHRALGVAPFVKDAPVVKATDPSAP